MINIGLDGLNIRVSVNIGKDRLILVKIFFEAYQYQPALGSDNTD